MKKTLLALCLAVGSLLPFAAQADLFQNNNNCCVPCPPPCVNPCNTVCDPWYLFGGVVHSGLFTDKYTVDLNATQIRNSKYQGKWGWQVFLGYKFVPCFGVEIGYVDLARQPSSEHVLDEATNNILTGSYRSYAVPFRGVFSVNFCDLTFSALFGVHYYNQHGRLVSGTTESLVRSKSGVDFNFGAAVEYKFIEWLGVRLDLARYYFKRFDNYSQDYKDSVSANLVTYF